MKGKLKYIIGFIIFCLLVFGIWYSGKPIYKDTQFQYGDKVKVETEFYNDTGIVLRKAGKTYMVSFDNAIGVDFFRPNEMSLLK